MIYTICDCCGKKMEGTPMTPFNIFAANNEIKTYYDENPLPEGVTIT